AGGGACHGAARRSRAIPGGRGIKSRRTHSMVCHPGRLFALSRSGMAVFSRLEKKKGPLAMSKRPKSREETPKEGSDSARRYRTAAICDRAAQSARVFQSFPMQILQCVQSCNSRKIFYILQFFTTHSRALEQSRRTALSILSASWWLWLCENTPAKRGDSVFNMPAFDRRCPLRIRLD